MSNFKKPKMVRIQNSLSIDMVKIKAGSFMMGSEDGRDNEKPIHKVTIDYDFELGKYPVTIAEYMHFAKENQEHLPRFKQEKIDYYEDKNLTDNAPIIGISWHNAVAYCKWLSEKTGKNYRLPSEAEWEYACRAGSKTKWCFGDDGKELKEYAWYSKNSDSTTHLVGKKKPNRWGLYDMHGNVWEWCLDDWEENYNKAPIDGSANHSQKEKEKLLRGGSWSIDAIYTRSAIRFRINPTDRINIFGFRLLRTLP